ncbi:putative toxin of predicted polymorphic toxin system [Melghiribacillus thermohalophilus]|uniref:Putative toxin of predicted polymorphic toxin system n=1 Tax=Melghiribacillus thermohalophilus TaxID=1324956 RepID=A0A4R3MPC8_9BACI|nr:pre-toxin TG domain-containing protein [Melghiribacillus thermohalophilus]TCT16440.1 putative toxin of predicted polymorphic toxin system [Melghiribacillus thermohalophilus]
MSTAKSIQQLITRRNLITGEKLSVGDRISEGFGLAASLIPIPGSKLAGVAKGTGVVFAGKHLLDNAKSLGSLASLFGSKLTSGFKNTGEIIGSGFRQARDKITSRVSKATEKVKSSGSKLWGGIKGLFGKKKKKPDQNVVTRNKKGLLNLDLQFFVGKGTGKDDDFAKEPFVPDEYWTKKAPQNASPGSKIEHYRYYNGKIEKSTVIYDDYGRQKFRVDHSNHGMPKDHSTPHLHEYKYGPGYHPEKGMEFRYNFWRVK